jgi:hypothetical protein
MSDDGRKESQNERADRNFGELLQELRVAQTGVQVLFAFLLTAPLQAGFTRLDRWDRFLLVVDIGALAVAAVCLIAPVPWHRALFRQHLKDQVVDAANQLAQVGLAFLGVGLTLSITLAVDLVTRRWLAITCGSALAVLAVMLWLVLPIMHRRRLPDPADDPDADPADERADRDRAG